MNIKHFSLKAIMKYFFRLVPVCILLFAIFGCTTPGNQPLASDAMAVTVKSGMIKDGKAHVYVFLGKIGSFPNSDPTDLFVNGVNIGGINRNECMFIEVIPGTYTFSGKERTSTMPLKSQPVTLSLDADQKVFLAFDIITSTSAGSAYLPVGSSGGAVVPIPITLCHGVIVDRTGDGVKTIQGMKIILPDNIALKQIQHDRQ